MTGELRHIDTDALLSRGLLLQSSYPPLGATGSIQRAQVGVDDQGIQFVVTGIDGHGEPFTETCAYTWAELRGMGEYWER